MKFARSSTGGRHIHLRFGRAGLLCLAVAFLQPSILKPAFAADKPPPRPDAAAPAVTPSSISATLEFDLPALDRALERRIPRRLATFDDRVTNCWHRRLFGKERDVECVYSGYIERTGPISLRSEHGRLNATVPLYGTVSAQGIRGLARLLHGTAQGQMTVYASARPRLSSDWSVSLDMSEGFRWAEPPTLTILGFRINLERYVEPRIRSELERVQADVVARARDLDIRRKAEAAWQSAFATVKIADDPDIWLRTVPQSVAFSGVHAESEVLEGSAEITGTAETIVGMEPVAPSPTPLPRLASDVSEPGRFEIIVPMSIDYRLIRQRVQDLLSAPAARGGMTVRDTVVYPSAGKIVVGLHLAPSTASGDGDWIYLTATPRIDTQTQVAGFEDVTFANEASDSAQASFAATLVQTLHEQLRLAYQSELERIIASANARLSRTLGNGFRSEAHLASLGLGKVRLLPDNLRLDMRAAGRLKILYGL